MMVESVDGVVDVEIEDEVLVVLPVVADDALVEPRDWLDVLEPLTVPEADEIGAVVAVAGKVKVGLKVVKDKINFASEACPTNMVCIILAQFVLPQFHCEYPPGNIF